MILKPLEQTSICASGTYLIEYQKQTSLISSCASDKCERLHMSESDVEVAACWLLL